MSTSAIARKDTVARNPSLVNAIDDLVGGLKRWELWSTLGWHDIRQRYRRSIIGPFWLTLSMGVMIGGLAYMYAGLFGQSLERYLPYVATGFIVFSLISALATDASTVFIGAGRVILQVKAPFSIYIYQVIWRNILIFAHNILIYVLVVIFVGVDLDWNILLAIPGLLLIVTMGLWVGILLGGLSARFRDVPPIVASVMQVAFFLTPVFWTPGSLPNRELFVHLNPFYHMIEVVRMPLMGQTPPLSAWLVMIGLNCIAALIAILFYARYRARIAYWV
jgi:ABC-type polysaccharide/polyol phosphate export permease